MPPKPFDPHSSKYDLSTYQGRFLHFLDIIDPSTLLLSDADVSSARSRVSTRSGDDASLWTDLKTTQAAINPGTDALVPRPLRMAAFLPMNVPIVFGMLSATTPAAAVSWQVVNASYNSGLNYANRSGAEVSTEDIVVNYLLAVGTAVGLTYAVRRLGTNGPRMVRNALKRMPFVVPYCAVAGAGAVNVYATRRVEITQGVPVTDESGNRLGVSREAGKQGVYKTILTRAMGLPLPVLVLPPLIIKALPAMASSKGKIALELVVVTMCLAGALPATIALYPQRLALDVNGLEPEFRNAINPTTGKKVEIVYANKGL